MSFVIRRKSDGMFAAGRSRYAAEFVTNLDYARVFTEKGPATNSMRNTFAKKERFGRGPDPEVLADLEIIPIRIVTEDRIASLERDSKWLGHLENAGVDNWEGISFAYELKREAGEEED